MSPIENVVPNLVTVEVNGEHHQVQLRKNHQERHRDLFGVQLEVTSLLLEAERRKLSVLQKELQVALEEGGSIKAKEHQKQELLAAITRIQAQHDHLEKEYRERALGALISVSSRSGGKMQEREKPRIAPKPVIPTKPKNVPPVRIQQKVDQNTRIPAEDPQNARTECGSKNSKQISGRISHSDKTNHIGTGNVYKNYSDNVNVPINIPYNTKMSNSDDQAHIANECHEIRYVRVGEKYYEQQSTIIEDARYYPLNENVPKNVPHCFKNTQKLPEMPPNLLNDSKRIYFEGREFNETQHKNTDGKHMFSEDRNAHKDKTEKEVHQAHHASTVQTSKQEQSTSASISEKCDKLYRKTLEAAKTPNSPSTVCCSILSSAAQECMGMINSQKKEFNGKIEKIDSLDSNSSDSGGFKDFLQLSPDKNKPPPFPHHQRKVSQPDFLTEKKLSEHKPFGHQRKSSQPDFETSSHQLTNITQPISHNSTSGYQTHTQPSSNNRQNIASAQAFLQFLPQTEQKILMHNKQHGSYSQERTDEARMEKPKPLINQGQFQQSSKKLEEILAQRLEKEKSLRKSWVCSQEGQTAGDAEEKMRIQRQMHQKLHADLQQTVKQIQEIQSTEYRLPQNRTWHESNRSQPAIGLKHTPKSRPTIFGTVASDLTPKDCSNRRSLPQTPQTKNFSTIFSNDSAQESSENAGIQHENALVYRDGNLLSGPLEALIQHMVPTEVYYPDRAYLVAFLLSSRLFIKPHDLLARVRSLCEQQQGLGSSTVTNCGAGQARFAEKLVELLAEWTDTFPYDFRDERMMEHVRKVTQQCIAINPNLRGNVSQLLHNLHPRLTALEEYEKCLENQTNTAPSEENHYPDISEICPNPAILAQQLTHVELERLSFIGPEEFVQAFAKETPHLETSFKDLKKTRNLEQYVQWFNRLSYFVATQVCKYHKKKQRVKIVEYWIETGRECFNIGNFNSLMAIIAGLNMSPISRLKKTWNKIQSGKFAILEHQMDPSSNFSSYRSTLKAAMWRSAGATDQRQRIVIPFFSLLVKDLYFLNQGCSNKLPNGHINFEKFWQLAKQVTEFMAWKQVTCPFEKDHKVINLLQHGPVLNENLLALASFECEPPDNHQEKERCKTLKAEGSNNAN